MMIIVRISDVNKIEFESTSLFRYISPFTIIATIDIIHCYTSRMLININVIHPAALIKYLSHRFLFYNLTRNITYFSNSSSNYNNRN